MSRAGWAKHRSEKMLDTVHAATASHGRGTQRTRNGLRLVMTKAPQLLHNEAGAVIGVEAHVRLYRGDKELPIDPVRRFVNPPLAVGRRGQAATLQEDPVEALWVILWDSVTDHPNPAAWVP